MMKKFIPMATSASLSVLMMSVAMNAVASGVMFKDIVSTGSANIEWERAASPSLAPWNEMKAGNIMSVMELTAGIPNHASGAPGIATFDYDNDGDLDIYVTNGPDMMNSLFHNQLSETGKLTFMDVTVKAGVEVTAEDSTGVCTGDVDNDGDQDLYVLTLGVDNYLFINNGDGTFDDMTMDSGTGGGMKWPSSCTLGDVNNDGLLDIAVGNSWADWGDRLPLVLIDDETLARKEHNQLFLNQGNHTFKDISVESNTNDFVGVTWGIALIDIDQDGDVDLVNADDQGPKAPAVYGGVDAGHIKIYINDGNGNFTDETVARGGDVFGAWMGISFGDVDGNGTIDIFSSNVGDYLAVNMQSLLNFPSLPEEWNSAVFTQDMNGVFTRQNNGSAGTSNFGWGSSIKDYDNDGDADIIYYGGLDMGPFIDASNPGSILMNNGMGDFTYDAMALSESVDHNRRVVLGVSVDDLNNDGFVDIVSAGSLTWPEEFPLMPYLPEPLGGQFDDVASIMPIMMMVDPEDPMAGFQSTGMLPEKGNLAIEVSDAGNGNNWVKVYPMGSVDVVDKAMVNRDGLGATFYFTPRKGKTQAIPHFKGGNYLSTESNELIFGMGDVPRGDIEVMWPGGTKNKLYNVWAGERIVIPEIPCSYDDLAQTFQSYRSCVRSSLDDLVNEGAITFSESLRFNVSMQRAGIQYRLSRM